jgi:hypothetical protein
MKPHQEPSDITTSSRISLPLAVTLTTAAVAISGMFASIKADLADLRRHVAADWTLSDMILWTSHFTSLNGSNVTIPQPEATWKRVNP